MKRSTGARTGALVAVLLACTASPPARAAEPEPLFGVMTSLRRLVEGKPVWLNTRPLAGQYRLARDRSTPSGLCVVGGRWPEPLCELTGGAAALGHDGERIVVRIDVEHKEYLVIDVRTDELAVVSREVLTRWPEAARIRLQPPVASWRERGRSSGWRGAHGSCGPA